MSPCYQCEDRKVGCQIECSRHHEWLAAERERKTKIWKAKHKEIVVDSFKCAAIRKLKKEKGK